MAFTVVESALTIQAVKHGKGRRAKYLTKFQVEYINMLSLVTLQHAIFVRHTLTSCNDLEVGTLSMCSLLPWP
jgi:hypothetical protein